MATTFAAGQTINLSLDGNDTITWVGSGNMTVTPASGPSWAVHLEGSQTYGPFGQAVSVSIVTVTNGSYTVNGGSFPAVANEYPLTGRIDLLVDGVRHPLNPYAPPVSQYDRALIFASPTRQANAVKGLSRNINDAQYVGAITDAEVYDTEAGALSVGQATSKALAFPWRKMLWDLSAGESLLVQARIKTVGATTSSNVLFGNSDGTVEGFGLVLYGPTHATTPGRLLFNFKATGTAGQAIVATPALVSGASVAARVLPTDAYLNITIHLDGATKRLDVWTNGEQGLNNSAQTLNAGSTINPTPRNFGIGYIPADDGFTASAAKAARLQAFRMAVLPLGLKFVNPGLLDRQFNLNPSVLFADADYVGSN